MLFWNKIWIRNFEFFGLNDVFSIRCEFNLFLVCILCILFVCILLLNSCGSMKVLYNIFYNVIYVDKLYSFVFMLKVWNIFIWLVGYKLKFDLGLDSLFVKMVGFGLEMGIIYWFVLIRKELKWKLCV